MLRVTILMTKRGALRRGLMPAPAGNVHQAKELGTGTPTLALPQLLLPRLCVPQTRRYCASSDDKNKPTGAGFGIISGGASNVGDMTGGRAQGVTTGSSTVVGGVGGSTVKSSAADHDDDSCGKQGVVGRHEVQANTGAAPIARSGQTSPSPKMAPAGTQVACGTKPAASGNAKATQRSQKSTSAAGGGKAQDAAANLPSKEQVVKYFFRVVAFLYDVIYLTGNWTIRFIDQKIVQNEMVQLYWKKFHEKMEQAKKD